MIGEAKGNSPIGAGQGFRRDKSQEELRPAYCSGLAPKVFPHVRDFVMLGVGANRFSVRR